MATENQVPASRIVASGGPVSSAIQAGRGETPVDYPVEYAMYVEGNCCLPEIPDGCHILCNTDRAPKLGDFVVIHFTPEAAARYGYEAWVKRLVMMQRPRTETRKPHYVSNVRPCLVVEQLNPVRCYVLDWSDIRAVHWCGGKLPAEVRLIPNPAAVARRAARKVEVAA